MTTLDAPVFLSKRTLLAELAMLREENSRLMAENDHLRFSFSETLAPNDDCVPFPDVRMRKSGRRLINLIHRKAPKTVTRGEMYTALTWDRPLKNPEPQIVPVQLYYAKMALAAAGIPWPIECVRGVGYRWIA
jgi:hypothetical protein